MTWIVLVILMIALTLVIIREVKRIKFYPTGATLIDKACDYLIDWNRQMHSEYRCFNSVPLQDCKINVVDFRKTMIKEFLK